MLFLGFIEMLIAGFFGLVVGAIVGAGGMAMARRGTGGISMNSRRCSPP